RGHPLRGVPEGARPYARRAGRREPPPHRPDHRPYARGGRRPRRPAPAAPRRDALHPRAPGGPREGRLHPRRPGVTLPRRRAAHPAHRRNVGLDRAAVGRPLVPAGLPALPRPPLLDAGVRGADRDLGGARVRDGSIESVMSTPEAVKHEILNEGPDELVMLWL